ncbi:MAG: glucose 1-dehydrogenase [Acidimicrobiia bacterium]
MGDKHKRERDKQHDRDKAGKRDKRSRRDEPDRAARKREKAARRDRDAVATPPPAPAAPAASGNAVTMAMADAAPAPAPPPAPGTDHLAVPPTPGSTEQRARSPFDLTGRTALVTGASRGIGAAIVRSLDAQGARVVLTARTRSDCEEVAAGLRNAPLVIRADLATDDGAERLAAEVLDAVGAVDVLVNNAGVARRLGSGELTGADIDLMYRVNVRNLLLLTARLIPPMVARGGGSVVNVSSVVGARGAPWRTAYAATKGAVDAVTRALAMEHGPQGIRVNAVAPGVVETAMWQASLAQPGVIDSVLGLVPLRRLSKADDVADVVAFLASDAARYVTGEVIAVDGGMAGCLNLYPSV